MIEVSYDKWRVQVSPERGGSIRSISCSNEELLYWSEGFGARFSEPSFEATRRAWLAGYSGGWNEILPNPGSAGEWFGFGLGFHGDTAELHADVQEIGQSALVTTNSATGIVLRRRVTASTRGVRVESFVEGVDNRAVPWLQHPIFALEVDTTVRTGDADIDGQLQVALASDRPEGFWVAEAQGEVHLGNTVIRWSAETWPVVWLWLGVDEGRRFLGVEPSSCSPDRKVIATQHSEKLSGWMEITKK